MKNTLLRLIFSCAALFLFSACSNEKLSPEPPRIALFMEITENTTESTNTYSGEIRARHQNPLSFRVAGKITARLVNAGDFVKKGDVLMRLDASDTKLSAASAAAQLSLAKAELERFRQLKMQNFVSQSALDAKETAYQSASAQANLANNQQNYTTLIAEKNGVIDKIIGEVGQNMAAFQTVASFSDVAELEVFFTIPESKITQIHKNQTAKITLWANEKVSFEGVLRELSQTADSVTRSFEAKVLIKNPDENLRLGMSANVIFTTENDAKIAAEVISAEIKIPSSALFQQSDGSSAVWLLNEDETVHLRPVKIAKITEKEVFLAPKTSEIGIAKGEKIIVAGVHKLAEGQKIKPQKSEF